MGKKKKSKKNKRIFELDNRQVTLAFAGLIVIGLLVFTTGVIVGTKGANKKEAESAEGVKVKIKAPSLLEEWNNKQVTASAVRETTEEVTNPVDQQIEAEPEKDGDRGELTAQVAGSPGAEKTTPPAAKRAKSAPADKPNAPSPAKVGEYFIQVASFNDEDSARKRAGSLIKKGYAAVVVKADIPGKGIWHRVRIGPFSARKEPESSAAEFEKKEGGKTFVTK